MSSEEEVLTVIQVVDFPEILDSLSIQEAPVFSEAKNSCLPRHYTIYYREFQN